MFQIWDSDGEGSLSPDELIKAFVQIGLSQDHHFAKKIMYAIKPPPSKGTEANDFEIKMRDFITIFRADDVSDNVIDMINQEVNFRKRKELENLKKQRKIRDEAVRAGNTFEGPATMATRKGGSLRRQSPAVDQHGQLPRDERKQQQRGSSKGKREHQQNPGGVHGGR